ncbi:Hydrogenase maturation factor [Halorhabdus sp. SVX81]|uniref:AIR synthase-related protein n=1 Tax=Halorhabdus sp. SVX81 TaxID=2978283 RepID=UPI0023D9E5A1|nr:AIR synthase-related protein [Halorhabdus sp. SVX81]WEL17358.1 Hydrogenase maturation factor [Halorhabdus sp. SVX81]
MPDRGKIDTDTFDAVIAPHLGARRDDVTLGPQHGVDFGVLSIDESALVVATDPISILPALGFERAGRLALDIVLTDVAVSGIAPTHATVSLSLPPEMSDDELGQTWRGMADHAENLGVSIVSGHTARYEGVEYSWVGGATALGVGDPDDIVRPDGANPGDAIVLATGPGAETAGLFGTLFPEALDLPAETVATAQERVTDIRGVADATTAAAAGDLTAMHDATEGGVVGGLAEMATGADVTFAVEREAAPVQPGVEAVCDGIDVDPWTVTSAGSLLITAPPSAAEDVVAALESRGTPAAIIGSVRDAGSQSPGVVLDGERVEPPASDPAWDAMARLQRTT